MNVDLQGACQVVVDIHSRFLFERDVFIRREKGTIPPAELSQLMTAAQLQTYGDALDPSALHPLHVGGETALLLHRLYNWPYCFGLLFGIGLYGHYQQDPHQFRAGYDDLLSSTGLGSAAAPA